MSILRCGTLQVVRETPLVSMLRYRHARDHDVRHVDEAEFPVDCLCVTTGGKWIFYGRRGRTEIGQDEIVAGSRRHAYGCAHLPGCGDENLIICLRPTAHTSRAPLFRKDVLNESHVLMLARNVVAQHDDRAFENAVFRLFEVTSELGAIANRSGLDLRMERLKRYIEERHTESVTLEDMAAEAGLSPFHFQHRFRSYFELSPYAYLLDFRIARAKELLRGRRVPVGEVGKRVGFADPSDFSRAFKRRVGVAPREFV